MKFLDHFEKVEEWFCGLALFATTLILFINVVLRYVFNASTTWAEELIRFIMVWIAFIGGSVLVRKNSHVAIDFFLNFISASWKKRVNIFVNSMCFIFSALMCWLGWELVRFVLERHQTAPALGVPMYVPYLALPLGFLLMTLRFAQNIFKLLKPSKA